MIDPKRDKILEANPRASQILGFTHEELLSKRISDLHPNEMPEFRTFTQSIFENGNGQTDKLTCQKENGQVIPVEIFASVIEPQGKAGIIALKHDVSEQKRSEELRRLSSAVFETATEGIIITDPNKNILSVNPGFTKITGYSAEEVVGKNPRMIQSGRHDESFYKKMWKTINTRGHWQGEIWNRRKDGEIYPEWLSMTAVKDEQGNVLYYTGLFSDIKKQKFGEENLRYQTHYDLLTGLPNQTLLFDRLSQAIKKADQKQNKTALLSVDLDHFNQVNNTLGHIAGDEILKESADRILACIRETDTGARLGGDEFLIVLSNITGSHDALMVAEKMIECFSGPFTIDGQEVFLGASIGITISPNDGIEVISLLKNACLAMDEAKAAGRNCFRFFNRQIGIQAQEHTLLEWDLSRALLNQEMVLYYQPVVELSSLKTICLEALIRWNHPERGLIPPDQFILLAENSGLISKIDQWVLMTACSQMMQWQKRYGLDTAIALNMSSRAFRSDELLPSLTSALEKSGLSSESLIIEITEGLMLDPNEEAIKKLQDIKDIGIRLSIDDFGTGYSSLSYLARYPIDLLKIDKSFIQGLLSDPHKKPLVEAIVKMGQSMGMKIIAEGVETHEDLAYLMGLGCDEAQGYYFSQPLSVEDYETVLKKQKNRD